MAIEDILLSALNAPLSSQETKDVWEMLPGTTHPYIKEFSSILYQSAEMQGLSMQYEPPRDMNTHSKHDWICKAVDVYNENGVKGWRMFPSLPLTLSLQIGEKTVILQLSSETSGIDLVSCLGEPSRKGGGEPLQGGGASGLGPPAWMEWRVKLCYLRADHPTQQDANIMVQLAGLEARGPHRWERSKGGTARWALFTIYLAD